MGSCFAQHIARHIQKSGLNYFVSESALPGMSPDQAAQANYGTFSARYGNIYTVRQAVQLFDRAFQGLWANEEVWSAPEGYVDAFRPRVETRPLASPESVIASRARHLNSVRTLFLEADWLIFTLGLTEAWRSRRIGAVYPLAPGVAGGEFDPIEHEFVNFTLDDVRTDLSLFLDRLRIVNPGLRVLLTVSPVPLIATYEPRHVLQSTVVSKSILRVAADEIERCYGNVIYFPSYEIIASPASGGRYYHSDLREVTSIGVAHVMRIFEKHFIRGSKVEDVPKFTSNSATSEISSRLNNAVVCDEEAIEDALRRSGL